MPLYALAGLLRWAITPQHFADRRLQACAAILFSMVMIVWCKATVPPDSLDERIVDWSFAAIISVTGIYHAARGVADWLHPPAPPTK
jgi:hypothetical protein